MVAIAGSFLVGAGGCRRTNPGAVSAVASWLENAGRSLGLVALVLVLTGVHLRRPQLHALQAGILLASLVIVWLGLDLAT